MMMSLKFWSKLICVVFSVYNIIDIFYKFFVVIKYFWKIFNLKEDMKMWVFVILEFYMYEVINYFF